MNDMQKFALHLCLLEKSFLNEIDPNTPLHHGKVVANMMRIHVANLLI